MVRVWKVKRHRRKKIKRMQERKLGKKALVFQTRRMNWSLALEDLVLVNNVF